MQISISIIIVLATCIVSYLSFNDRDLKYKLTFSPYSVKHYKRWWLIFSHGLIHADYAHLAMNMFTLYFIGRGVEYDLMNRFGSQGILVFLLLYIGGMAFATIPAFNRHQDNPGYMAVGASGAVSAVLFAFIIMNPFESLYIYGIIAMPALLLGVLYMMFETYANKNSRTNIAHDAHIAGAIFGMVFLVVYDYTLFFEFIDNIKYQLGQY